MLLGYQSGAELQKAQRVVYGTLERGDDRNRLPFDLPCHSLPEKYVTRRLKF